MSSQPSPTNSTVRILLIEDDENDYLLTCELLSDSLNYDYEIDWVAEFDEALTCIAEARHDLYLMDYRLGHHSGLDLLKQAIAGGCTAPIIIVTGQGDESIDHEAMRCGAEAYLTKGFENAETLERVIRYTLARKISEAALKESEQRQRAILANIDEVVYLITRDSDDELKTHADFVTNQAECMTGYALSAFMQDPFLMFNIAHPDDAADIKGHVKELLSRTSSTTLQYRIKHGQSGEFLWLENRIIPLIGADGKIESLVGIARDITESKTREETLIKAALHDKLTGLPNRAMLLDHLEGAINRGRRHKDFSWAVLFIDLDGFKPVNDTFGHQAGDELLIGISKRLADCIRPGDTLARIGGDEFVILLEDIRGENDANQVANRIQLSLQAAHAISNQDVYCSASIGITMHREKYTHPDEVLKDADYAMYKAKAAGKSQHAVFETCMQSIASLRNFTRNSLQNAIDNEEFEVHYQPIVSMETYLTQTFEALLRWKHPIWGLIEPAEFLPLAEESGLIIPIGKWMIRAACKQQAQWKAYDSNYTANISINLAPRQFAQSDLAQFIETTLSETGLHGYDISFDLPENAIPQNYERAESAMQMFAEMGIDIAIDSFGEGQAALSTLYRYPVRRVKIDRNFITSMKESNRHTAIVRSIVHLAHNLGIEVVAVQVERDDQVTLLKNLACDYVQGYLFSRPLTADQATGVLQQSYSQAAS